MRAVTVNGDEGVKPRSGALDNPQIVRCVHIRISLKEIFGLSNLSGTGIAKRSDQKGRVMQNYCALAPRYDACHARWLRYAGGPASIAFEAAVMALLRSGSKVLDAGAGTGALARRLLNAGPRDIELTLLDKSPAMLAQAHDIPCQRVEGCLMDMPFDAASFDMVLLAWSIEAVSVPNRAVGEAMRVLKPGGTLVMVFCSDAPAGDLGARLISRRIQRRKLGRFLRKNAMAATLQGVGAEAIVEPPAQGPATVLVARKRYDLMQRRAA